MTKDLKLNSGLKMKLDNFYELISILDYGKPNALTAEKLFAEFHKSPITNTCPEQTCGEHIRTSRGNQSLEVFKRHLRTLSHEARLNGHKVIGDDNGYYIALTLDEWSQYKRRRLSSFTEEIKAFASIEKISIRDIIKNLFIVDLNDKNYELF